MSSIGTKENRVVVHVCTYHVKYYTLLRFPIPAPYVVTNHNKAKNKSLSRYSP